MARLLKDTTIGDIPILDYIYPVGVIIETTYKNFNPSTYWGGTWKRIKGKCIVGVDEAVNEFNESAVSGGEMSHTLKTDELPSHNHHFMKDSCTMIWGKGDSDVHAPNCIIYAGGASNNALCTYQNICNRTDNTGGDSLTTIFNRIIQHISGKELLKYVRGFLLSKLLIERRILLWQM